MMKSNGHNCFIYAGYDAPLVVAQKKATGDRGGSRLLERGGGGGVKNELAGTTLSDLIK